MSKKKEIPVKEDNIKLKKLMDTIDKRFGKNTFNRVGDMPIVDIPRTSSGSFIIDQALGGGYPVGRIIELFGENGSGKTSCCLHAIAECQKGGRKAAIIDTEHSLDLDYAKSLGVDTDNLFMSQPSSGEIALEILDMVINSGEFGMVVVDSVAALTPQKEIDGEMGDSVMGVHARLMSQACRKIVAKTGKNACTVIFTNQIRNKIGVVFGSPLTTPGGHALKFYTSQRLHVSRKTGNMKDANGNPTGQILKVKVVKNKVAPPFRVAETELVYGEGISLAAEVRDLAVDHDIMKKSGSWYSYNGVKVGQGGENTKQFLLDNPETMEEILNKIKEKINS